MTFDETMMQQALQEARAAQQQGELPVGCVITYEGKIIARAHNEREQSHDPTAHAEVVAIRRAAKYLNRWRLNGCTLYVTLEPCPMCAGAISQARLDRLVYGAPDPNQGCAGSVYRIPEDPAFTHFCPSDGGVLADECRTELDAFFMQHRMHNQK